MAKITAQQYAEKWARRTKAAVEDMRLGIQNVTVSPTELAAQKQEKMLSRLTESVQSGKWASGLRRVTLDDWKNKMLTIGVNRVATGVEANIAKAAAFAAEVIPHIEAGQAKIKAMSDVSLEDSIARMTEWTRHMSKFRRK